ncbi:hypothetical protein TELCIR_12220 [Teladorsagia circumcincta]|uniref:Protein FAM184A/B N-terminal domain-containing protein n=1 Tax=Teladorsagia circumcincta TaxID=45464 RepID=A0A2G9U7A4_TELCI|nr:hypothetical protein TELCIR_12220 [Teladorsagia circumcincta]
MVIAVESLRAFALCEWRGAIHSSSPSSSTDASERFREPREIAVAIPLVRDSRPEINPWPAPPQNVPLTCISGNVRERVAERERKLEAEYSSKIIALSEEVLGAKKDFEARMKSFQALQDKFEREKEQALEKLRQEHQKEIQLLEQRFSESQLLNLEQK